MTVKKIPVAAVPGLQKKAQMSNCLSSIFNGH